MELCVGATSRRVVEVAAALGVHQIVASRAQVNETGGYVGLDQADLVGLVTVLSGGETRVVRDHGGPLQGGFNDDGVRSLQADVDAGFDGLHIDVCKLPKERQPATLVKLVQRFEDSGIAIEVGGEHEDQFWNDTLLDAVLKETEVVPRYAVISTGTHVWADTQVGQMHTVELIDNTAENYRARGVKVKAHNMDWVGGRVARYGQVLDAYNIAPEFARVETDALLTALGSDESIDLLRAAYKTGAWTRWFNQDEGTWFDRARCAVHYVQNRPEFRSTVELDQDREAWLRGVLWDAITAG